MTFLIVYTLTVYFIYHVVARSDLLARPRQWLVARLPGWLAYPLECAFCLSWWIGASLTAGAMVTTGTLSIDPVILCAAPVLCYLIGLTSSALHRYLDVTAHDFEYPEQAPVREPPVLETHPVVDLSKAPTTGPVLGGTASVESPIDSLTFWKQRDLEQPSTEEPTP